MGRFGQAQKVSSRSTTWQRAGRRNGLRTTAQKQSKEDLKNKPEPKDLHTVKNGMARTPDSGQRAPAGCKVCVHLLCCSEGDVGNTGGGRNVALPLRLNCLKQPLPRLGS